MKKNVLFVDGYNMIGAWPELVKLKRIDELADARDVLLAVLSNYAKYTGIEVRVVFDAQFVPGIQQQYDIFDVQVIFTKEGETADSYIERVVGEENLLTTNVSVATSDLAEQWMVFQKGAARVSANELYKRMKRIEKTIEMDANMYNSQRFRRNSPLKAKDLEALKKLYEQLTHSD
ncbi:NYN domain-containing protein [Lacticigenium naphthae]|uniref:NYN domain-containing protein n=1 Tax=Lacticigenium naphthae TaxID=515351 RepID=UPI000429CD83|nr:NYN domain-containing protein [Lacticigenium naphthae]